jgi:F-type H+-transporting ATPase subunit b
MLNTLLLAAEEEGGASLILPHTEELIWGAIAFLIVFFVLWKWAFPALEKSVKAREEEIQSNLEAAENEKQTAEQKRKEYEKQIGDARAEANRIIEDARQQAEQVRKDLVAKAEREAEQIVERAQEQIEAERNRTVTELQTTVADLSIELAEKVVGRALDGGAHRELVDNYIREVAGMGGNGRGSQN